MPDAAASPPGRVVFVGAGPGAPDLLTVRARDWLARADVVVHDALVPDRLLDAVGCNAERIPVARAPHGPDDPGAATGRLLVGLATAGRTVVRLKGGDPTVFARLAEELAPLRAAGVPVEFVPGVTAALAAASAAGVPLTSRDAASSLTLVTGHEAVDKNEELAFHRLAALPGTLVVYMGVDEVARWSRNLMQAGMPGETPVTVVSRCSWPDERVAASTLAACADAFVRHGWRPPTVVIVGAVARPAGGPLAGRRVLVTRPAGQEGELVALVRAEGGECSAVPLVEIIDPPSWQSFDDALGRADTYDWIVFSSANGVRAFVRRLRAAGRDGRALGTARLAAIGPATRRQLEAAGFVCDLVPDTFRSEELADALAGTPGPARFLLVRAERGREVLPDRLRAAGHQVEEAVAYVSRPREVLDPDAAAALADGTVDWITLTSPSIAAAAVRLCGPRLRDWRIASISPVTTAALRRFGLEPTVEAPRATAAGLVEAMTGWEAARHAGTADPGKPAGRPVSPGPSPG